MKLKIVKINDVDESGVPLNLRAWKFSRNNDETKYSDVVKLDLPANEIPSAVIEFESTIIEREIMASMRDHSMWARTSRVDDPLKFEIASILRGDSEYSQSAENARNKMLVDKKRGIRQDEYRLHMPLFAITKFTMSINFRSIVILQRYFSHLYHLSPHSAMGSVYYDAAGAFKFIIRQFTNYSFLEGVAHREILPEVKEVETGKVGDFITYSGEVPFSLRTHIIRHRTIFMNDQLKEIALHEEFSSFNLSTRMSISITSSVEFWKDIVTKRSCWLVHYSMWHQIIKGIFRLLPELGEDILPCNGDGKSCCYEKDVLSRCKNEDPNPPCPIYLTDNGIKVNEIVKQNISKQFVLDSRPLFWTKRIGEVK